MRRKWHRLDLNHTKIMRMLESAYFSVCDLSMVGNDCPDLLVAKNGVDRLVEIKTPSPGRMKHDQQLSEGQKDFQASWRGAPVIVAHSIEEILAAFEQRRIDSNIDFLQAWMRTPNPMLGNMAPLTMLRAGFGHRLAAFIEGAAQ
jgi:prenyltransferase beta subunit